MKHFIIYLVFRADLGGTRPYMGISGFSPVSPHMVTVFQTERKKKTPAARSP